MTIKCPDFEVNRQRRAFDPQEKSDIRRRVEQSRRIRRLARQSPRNEARVAARQAIRQEAQDLWESLTSNIIHLDPSQGVKLQDMLVTQFGQMNRLLGLDPSSNFTAAGEVRYSLLEGRQIIEGLISNAGRIVGISKMNPMIDTFNKMAANLHIPHAVKEELLLDIIEVGQIPRNVSAEVYYRHSVLGHHSLADVVNQRRYQRMRRSLLDRGFSDQQINMLVNMSADVSNSFDQVAAFARAVGVDIDNLENIGYFSRSITRDFQNRLRDISAEDLLQQVDIGGETLATIHNRSRNTWHFLPEDVAFVSQVLDRTPQEIRQLLDDPLVWRKYLHENLSTNQLDTLVDAGVLQKFPMTSREVFEYFVRQYEMPYEHLNEMFITNPHRVLQEYTNSLATSAGRSAMLRRIVDGDALRQGWAVTGTVYRQNPQFRESGFVPLGDRLQSWTARAQIPGLNNNEVLSNLNDMYVHPVVADQFSWLIRSSVSPTDMHNIGTYVYLVKNWFNKRVLTTLRYPVLNALQSAISAGAAGANMALLPKSFLDLGNLIRGGFDVFDNTIPRYRIDGRDLTQRQAFEFFLINRGHSVAPGSDLLRLPMTDPRQLFDWMMSVPQAAGRALDNLVTYTMAHGDPVNGRRISPPERAWRFGKKSGQMVNELLDGSFATAAFIANYFDLTAKWALFQSTARRIDNAEAVIRLGQKLTSGQMRVFDTSQELFKHMDDYFINAFNAGYTTRFVNNYIRPFSIWAMGNLPAQFRHMIRNPSLYLAYHRIRSFMNTPLAEDERYTDANVPSWILESYPGFVTYDEDGNPIVLMPGNFDSISDSFQFVLNTGATINRLWGNPVGTQEQIREMHRGETWENVLMSLVGQTHIPWKILVEQITGRDSFTGREFTVDDTEELPTFMGIRMPPRMIYMLNKVPFLDSLDRLNPGGVFGTPARRDSQGRVIDPGSLSIFGTERNRLSSRDRDSLDDNFAFRLMQIAGINIRTIDYDRNINNTMRDIEITADHLRRGIDSSRNRLHRHDIGEDLLSPEEYNRILRERDEAINLWFQYMYDFERVKQWGLERGIPTNGMLYELFKLEVNVRQLPDPNQETIERLLREAMEMRQ